MNLILIIMGVVMLVFSIFAFTYIIVTTDEYLGGIVTEEETETPFRGYTVPLIIGGIILILVGAFMPTKTEK
jgi:formate hydrogenlyase subunit 3/multisubunit Na+/H+ antiporter MnhD subunit